MAKLIIIFVIMMLLVGCTKQDAESQPMDTSATELQKITMRNTIDSLKSEILKMRGELDQMKGQDLNEKDRTSNEIKSKGEKGLESSDKNAQNEWKKVRNGASLTVKWQLKVMDADYRWCYLYSSSNMYDADHLVLISYPTLPIHTDDVIIVSGEASGVDNDGKVKLRIISMVNKGVE
jgi:hypothetical protein